MPVTEDNAEILLDFLNAAVTAGVYNATTKVYAPSPAGADLTPATIETTGNVTVGGNATVTGHVGFNGKTAVGKSAAYTLTYSTPGRTVPAATAASVATTGSTTTTPWGYASQAQADAIPVAINAVEADVLALKQLIVALVLDSQAVGIAG